MGWVSARVEHHRIRRRCFPMAAYEGSEVMECSTVAHKCQDQSKTNTKTTTDSVGQWKTASTKLHIAVCIPSLLSLHPMQL